MDAKNITHVLRNSFTDQPNDVLFSRKYMSEIADFIEQQEKSLLKINDIRNSIVGFQTINWSEHIYPLVAALNEAGVKGLPYPEAKKNNGTIKEKITGLESEVAVLREALGETKLAILKEHREEAMRDSFYDLIIFGHINPALEITETKSVMKVQELEKYAELGRLAIKTLNNNKIACLGIFEEDDESDNHKQEWCKPECDVIIDNECVDCVWIQFCQKRAELKGKG